MNAEQIYDKLNRCYDYLAERMPLTPRVGLVLGSGLGDFARTMDVRGVIPYAELPDFPVSTAPGHAGQFVFGMVGETPVVCMQGRVHYYEGYDIADVVLPIRLMALIGAETLFLTNASGGIRSDLKAGDLMLISDQISFFVPSPLRGANLDMLGVRFPDMTEIYDKDLRTLAREEAAAIGIDLKEGVYIQTKGPNYESPAEVQLCKRLGADAVGMSTCCEAIAANHMNMKILGISCIANLAAGIADHPLTEEEVIEAGKAVSEKFTALVAAIIKKL